MDTMFCLHPAVFYRNYDGYVVVYQTERQKVYTFNESAGDILECFRDYATVSDAVETIALEYKVEDPETLWCDVSSFIDEILDKGILREKTRQTGIADDLEKEISSHFAEGEQIYSATIELTYKCNERCRHCYIADEHRQEMQFDTVKRVLDELSEMNVLNVVFTGGEVFTRKDAFDILEYAYSKQFLIDIFTNGNLIDGNDYIRLKSIWPRCVHFSLYSNIPEKHDAVTQIKGSFEKTLKSIKSCVTIGIPVNIKTPIFAETMDDVQGIVELANELGCSVELGKNITPKKNGDLTPVKMQITGDDNENRIADTIDELILYEDNRVFREKRKGKICGAGDRAISINPYGEVFPCNMLQLCIGDINQNSIRDMWLHSEKLKWWRDNNRWSLIKGCEGCNILDQCTYCPGEAMMRTGDPLKKYGEACRIANNTLIRAKKGGMNDGKEDVRKTEDD